MDKVCNYNIDIINQYFDGMLDEEEKTKLLDHITKCQPCKKYFDEIKALKKHLSQIKIEVPDTLVDDVLNNINNNKKKKISISRIVKYSSAAVAACLVLTFSLLLYFNNNNTKATEEKNMYGLSQEVENCEPESASRFTLTKGTTDNALADEETMKYNIVFSTNAYTVEEIKNIVNKEFNIDKIAIMDDSVSFPVKDTQINELINRLKLDEIESSESESDIKFINIIAKNSR